MNTKKHNDEQAGAKEGEIPELPEGVVSPRAGSINEPPGSNVLSHLDRELPSPPGETAPPVIVGLDPDEAEIGSADVIMHVHGSGFTADSVIVFNGGDEATSFVSATELTTGVKPSLVGDAVVVPVLVRNGTVESEPFEFEFLEPDAPTTARKATKKRRR